MIRDAARRRQLANRMRERLIQLARDAAYRVFRREYDNRWEQRAITAAEQDENERIYQEQLEDQAAEAAANRAREEEEYYRNEYRNDHEGHFEGNFFEG